LSVLSLSELSFEATELRDAAASAGVLQCTLFPPDLL